MFLNKFYYLTKIQSRAPIKRRKLIRRSVSSLSLGRKDLIIPENFQMIFGFQLSEMPVLNKSDCLRLGTILVYELLISED